MKCLRGKTDSKKQCHPVACAFCSLLCPVWKIAGKIVHEKHDYWALELSKLRETTSTLMWKEVRYLNCLLKRKRKKKKKVKKKKLISRCKEGDFGFRICNVLNINVQCMRANVCLVNLLMIYKHKKWFSMCFQTHLLKFNGRKIPWFEYFWYCHRKEWDLKRIDYSICTAPPAGLTASLPFTVLCFSD